MAVQQLDPNTLVPGSPLWWLSRLDRELDQRLPYFTLMQRYADGESDNPTASEQASNAFRRLMGLSRTNICGLITEATAERLTPSGFRFGDDPNGDSDAWNLWQRSDFDAESPLVITDALTCGRSFISVDTDGTLNAEDPRQVVVAYAPGNRRQRLAALKRWTDDWTGATFATLYLPDAIYRVRDISKRPTVEPVVRRDGQSIVLPAQGQSRLWVDRATSAADVVEAVGNPLGEVPFFELRNRPRTSGAVRSEIEEQLDPQDRANAIALNGLIAAEFGAFRQKWATGIEVPKNADGSPIEPVDVAVHRLLVAPGEGARFGDFNATDLAPYIALYESTVQHMAATSRTPASYLLGNLINLSAEALAAAESGLVKKCQRRAVQFEQAFEGAMRLAFKAVGDPKATATNAETIWADMEIRSAAQAADAAVKLVSAAIIPAEQAQEDLGYSETQRERMRQWAQASDSLGALTRELQSQANLGGGVPGGFLG